MNNIKRNLLIAILIVLVLIIIVIISLINLNESNELNNGNNVIAIQPEEDEEAPQDTLVDYTSISRLNSYYIFDLEDKINLLFYFIQSNKNVELNNLISDEYRNNNEINTDNILETINLPYSEFIIQEVYSSENENNGKYYIYGLGKKEEQNITLEELYFIIDVDYKNSSFEIALSNENTFNNAKEGTSLEVENKTISQNGYNRIEMSNMTTEQVVKKYINDYKNKALYKPEYVYKVLSNENKLERFNSIEDYIKYVQENREDIEKMSVTNYTKQIENEYIEYNIVCDNSRYIIKAEEIMNYTISIQ